VALALLSGGLTFSGTLLVRHGRLMAEQRQYRVALDELSNQLERLAGLPFEKLTEAAGSLQTSDFAAERLPGARLKGEVQTEDDCQRLTVSITWAERREGAAPLALSAWIYPRQGEAP
jgi:hypothetical protein